MTTEELKAKLNYVNKSRDNRLQYAQMILDNTELLPLLMKIALSKNEPLSGKAAWILEFSSNQNLPALYPHLDYFCNHLDQPNSDSAIRPVAKICELLVTQHFKASDNGETILKPSHLENITEFCFDVLIGDHQVAPKAYSMAALEKLGQHYDWINPELKIILERDYPSQSKGYQARARKVLALIK